MKLPLRSLVIHGGAKGADTEAGIIATSLGHDVQMVRAEWDKYGKSAGYKRNKKMIEMQPDLVLAFSNGSRGTQHTINLARAAGIETRVFGKEHSDDDGF
jgi:hypothetical protein